MGYYSNMPEPVTVFVVDEEPVIATTLVTILNMYGFRATAFANATDTIKAAQDNCPSALVTEIVMREMNGVDLAIHIKSICPNCKVLLCSGQYIPSDVFARATRAGCDYEVLAKPLQPDVLINEIRAALGL